jgi:hypothetical protein
MDVHTWRSPTAQAEARWLTFLAGTGYPLSPGSAVDGHMRGVLDANLLVRGLGWS